MGYRECRDKARELIREAMQRSKPIRVEPKHRISGPVPRLPSEWWTLEGQKKVTLQCLLCHSHQAPDAPSLKRGLCEPCYLRTSTDTPEAA